MTAILRVGDKWAPFLERFGRPRWGSGRSAVLLLCACIS